MGGQGRSPIQYKFTNKILHLLDIFRTMNVTDYIDKLNTRFKTGISTEHSYRGDLQNLIGNIVKDVLVTNEPARVACGAPDYIITKHDIPIGYIEAKDIGADLDNRVYKEQFDRYKHSLSNLIITDYLTFELFREGEKVASIQIGKTQGNKITAIGDNFNDFTALIKDFCTHVGQTIKSPSKLAKMMAGKARLMANIIEASLNSDHQDQENSSLRDQMDAFKQILIHDIKPKEFADIYSQTIAYGMFAARLHDTSLEDFTRQEAAELIPKSNPFLRKLFQYIAGYDLDTRIVWIVDALAEIFSATNVAELLNDFGKATQQHDPIIHFYETFLSEYDPALRKSRGVWYTPAPVVNFIVRAVDDILRTEFDLKEGLADTSKTKIKIKDYSKATSDLRSKTKVIEREEEVHRVQILDPATGTGTFLAEVVKNIFSRFEGQEGIWSKYVEQHLLPRLNGFEILMASYAMAHLKLDMLLTETGYKPNKDQRFRIYLTNSLEEHHPDTGTLWANWLSTEANEANRIKRDTPVMCVIGNPPYSVSSSNKSEWIEKLIADYKKDLNERNIQPLSDDYIKFIRFGQHFIDKNGSGILAYISNNSFIDGIMHRRMRKHLLESFDKVYILDLHGNSKKKEICPDGSIDQNVFDIMQGVSINIFVKTGKKRKSDLGQVLHFDLFGKREIKYDYLQKNSLNSLQWNELSPIEPNHFLVLKNFDGNNVYEKGFKVEELFVLKANGIKTQRDDASIRFTKEECDVIKSDFINLSNLELIQKYDFKDVRDWTIDFARSDLKANPIIEDIIAYRPFDFRRMNYTGKTKGIMGYPRFDVMKHFLSTKENFGLILVSQPQAANLSFFDCIFIVRNISDTNFYRRGGPSCLPLYLYSEINSQKSILPKKLRNPNLNLEIVHQIAIKLNLVFTEEKELSENTFAPIDILDYIYAVLHSPTYRNKYKEFLKIDFPRVPYPKDSVTFWKLVKLGSEIRQIHLLDSSLVEKRITTYPISGNNLVEKLRYENGKVWINDGQYFDCVPEVVWSFYIGGYQPAQKWLKDRKGRELSFEDILHYQKIIVALSETIRFMCEIDNIEFC